MKKAVHLLTGNSQHLRLLAFFSLVAISITVNGQARYAPQITLPLELTRYKGVEVCLISRSFKVNSDIPELRSIPVSQLGTQIGGTWASQVVKLRANLAVFYSNGNVSRTIDTGEASVAGNLYVLKLSDPTVHRIEPYVTARLGYQRSKFYGTYVGDRTVTNYSMGSEPYLGCVDHVRGVAGVGAEWRMIHTTEQFIHFFAEVSTAVSVRTYTSQEAFQHTNLVSPVRVSIAFACGLSVF